MDGRSRPFFWGVDHTLNSQQKEALAQGVQQVVGTTPIDFQFFKFQFVDRQVYIYKLDHGLILLVLTQQDVVSATYLQAIERLQNALQADLANGIATFRLLAGSIRSHPSRQQANPVTPPVCLQDLLIELNHLSQFSARYLGATLTSNYWKSSRPAIAWLDQFEVDRAAQIRCGGPAAACLSRAQIQSVQLWVAAFVDCCSRVIRDFPALVNGQGLDDHQKQLLLPDPSQFSATLT